VPIHGASRLQVRKPSQKYEDFGVASIGITGSKSGHSVSCDTLQPAAKTAQLQGIRVDSATDDNSFPPTKRDRMSDDAKFILGIG
jgi:hypothetical protein